MQVSPLLQLLALLDNLYIVGTLVLITIAIRQLWVVHLKQQSPSPKPAATRKANQPEAAAKPHRDVTLEIIDTVLIALILVFGIVRPFFLQTFFIPSPSMEPTLLGPEGNHGGDKLIANKFVYRFRHPQRGEIIVFRPPRRGHLRYQW